MDAILQLDQNILLFIQEYIRHDWMDWFWKGITHLGDFGIFWILLTIVLLIPKKTRKAGLASALGTYYRNTDHKCGDKECGCQNKAV